MKIAKKIYTGILLSTILLMVQIGEIQAHTSSSDGSVKTNQPQNNNTSYLPVLQAGAQTGSCHFGITALSGAVGYDLSVLGVSSYLDWAHRRNNLVANNIDYIPMVQVSDELFPGTLINLPANITANPGATWLIGNEPDSEVAYQDHISAETYADRYFQLANIIRVKDPTAKIAFGTVIQTTPIRMYYLTRAIDYLTQLENGDRAKALGLIDIYSIHAFILNEHPLYDAAGNNISWGAGVPVGYDPASWPAYQEITGDQTHDINLFTTRVTTFRTWMKGLGASEQSKPLWITEYGSLFPTWLDVSDQTTATYMEQTFDFMLGTKDPNLGLSSDDNRLVQKWMWYSLNDDITHFGGSLYNPQNHQLTLVGDHFINYNPPTSSVPEVTNQDVYVDGSSLKRGPGTSGSYKITLKVGNSVSSDRLTGVQIHLLIGGTIVGSVQTNLPRCAGILPISFNLNNLLGGQSYILTAQVSLMAGNGIDIVPGNNQIVFAPFTMPNLYKILLPAISK